VSQALYGQNLIPNSGFEQIQGNCNSGASYLMLSNWTYPDCSHPGSYFNACNNSVVPSSGIPQSGLGFQSAQEGVAFSGLGTFSAMIPQGNPRVYPSVDLVSPLVAGEVYCLRLFMNLIDSSSYKTNVLNALFWYGIPSACSGSDSLWDSYSQITFDISDVDTIGWTMLESSFVANGGETSLVLGAFQFGSEIDTTFIAHRTTMADVARYAIDDVWVWPCEVGVEEHANERLHLYPNPATDLVRVALNAGEEAGTVSVLDMQGRAVLQQAFRGAQAELDVSGLSSGAYVVQLRTERTVLSAPLQVVR
jgi:hypothetical protein